MLSNISDSRSNRVELTDAEGSPIGSLEIPRDLTRSPNSTLIITFTDGNQNSSNLALGEVVLDITLLNSEGQEITDLDSPLTVCFPRPNNTGHKDLCLGFYSEVKGRWKCEDLCLTKKGNELCGQTDHLTNFALLLMGNLKEDPCTTKGENILAWISLGLIGIAILFVLFGICLIEVRYRRGRHKVDQIFFVVENPDYFPVSPVF